ncbi:MAG: sigma-70 family RNA polymerase sigma factor [Brumimicrobium sp.]|nr:sigma-70 family RNA polymerase sigma factor [Brumimicrobium sp.]MCO5268422.1 sigma-70 family RNA polymerase sigma factor [Brumimicrobium sp.]
MKAINPVYHHTVQMLDKEQEWVRLAKESPSNFAPLYVKYYAQIHRYVLQQTNNSQLAGDITSQIFIKAIKNISRYEFRGLPLASWLYRIAKSEVNQMYREIKPIKIISIDDVQVYTVMQVFEEETSVLNKNKLFQSLAKLKENDLELIKLRFFENYSFKEIGEILKITENNAKVKTFRALHKLKELFYVG